MDYQSCVGVTKASSFFWKRVDCDLRMPTA